MGELTKKGNQTALVLVLIDVLYQYPMTKIIPIPDLDLVNVVVKKEIKATFDNMAAEKKSAMMQALQTQWAVARKELVGNPAPLLVLNNAVSGEKVDISKDKGKDVFIHFFSIDCDHCEDEIDWVTKITAQMPELQVYGISVDVGEVDSVRAYIREKGVAYTILLPDENQSYQLDEYYGGATPQSVIIDKNGNVREVMVGFNKSITAKFETLLQKMKGE